MKLLVAVLAILGTSLADCGCLKCSKHLSLVGSVPGAPGCSPVKVIYRSDCCNPTDAGLQCGYLAAQPIVQVPVVPPAPPSPTCGQELPVMIQHFHRPLNVVHGHKNHYSGRSYLGRSCFIDRRPGLLGGIAYPDSGYPGYEYEEGFYPEVEECGILPVTVQKPLPPSPPTAGCSTLQGLTTYLDRVIVPSPPSHPIYHHGVLEHTIPTCCGPIKCPLVGKTGCCGYLPHAAAHAGSSSCVCHDRYEHQKIVPKLEYFANPKLQTRSRHKRQLPIIQNGYKFMMNMLPKFIQTPIKNTVNSMALTHPDPKLRKVYNLPPPKLSLQERLAQKHKENVAAIKNKLFGSPVPKKYPKKYDDDHQYKKYVDNRPNPKKYYRDDDRYDFKHIDDNNDKKQYPENNHYKYYEVDPHPRKYVRERLVDQEADNFLESLQTPQYKNRKSSSYFSDREAKHKLNSEEYPWIVRPRSPFLKEGLIKNSNLWMEEFNSNEVLGEHFIKKPKEDGLSEKEKALFLLKLKKLNNAHSRLKRGIDKTNNRYNSNHRAKRSVIIGSEELSLPLYQIRIRDSYEDNEIDDGYNDDYDYRDDSNEQFIVESRRNGNYDSREDYIRHAIREELKNFKNVKSEEDYDDYMVPHQKKKWISKYPLLNILTFPAKVLKNLNNEDAFPVVGAVPRMLVGTKRYFRDFGKNLKKNFLHFTSDMIGDFDHYGPMDSILDNLVDRKRYKRSLDVKDTTRNGINNTDCQNFQIAFKSKVRKKRYIIKMVDDDEIEELLREKLGKLIEEPQKNHKPKRKHRGRPNNFENSEEQRKLIEHLYGGLKTHRKSNNDNYFDFLKHKSKDARVNLKKMNHVDSIEDLRRKIIIEPIKPKVIIDNNGLPFMEINGYKRPIFMKRDKKTEDEHNSVENTSFNPYDSSEEVNLQKINYVITRAKHRNDSPSKNPEIPLQAIKEKISQLLSEIDVLVHMDCEKFDQIYDDLIEMQAVKTSIVQSWKRIILDKRINDYQAKISLLEKFTQLQQVKDTATKNIVYTLYDERENSFSVKKLTGALASLQKVQCIINQVVECFQEKFKTGGKFDVSMEVKFVDFLASLKFVQARTRNEMVNLLEDQRDFVLQENIHLLEKLKRLLVEDDDDIIEEEANVLWEMQHVHKMQISTIEEMTERLEEGTKIKKCLKILFDLQRRLKNLEEREKKIRCPESNEISEESHEQEESNENGHHLERDNKKLKDSKKKFHLEEFKIKWQKKIDKQKILIEENFKKKMKKLKELKTKSPCSAEDD